MGRPWPELAASSLFQDADCRGKRLNAKDHFPFAFANLHCAILPL
jgi:hypothetical protein